MSLEQVQARADEITSRLRALGAPATSGGTLGVAGPAADVFAGELQAAVARSNPGTGTTTAPAPGAGTSSLRAAGSWSTGLPAAGQRYAPLVEQAAQKAGVDPRLLAALAWSESGFDPGARSAAGAQGLVQLMPATARGLGVTDTSDPAQSLAGGARYLKQQLDAFGGDPRLALAAYNAGPTAVRRYGGVPPYAETQKYVTTVLDRFRSLGGTP